MDEAELYETLKKEKPQDTWQEALLTVLKITLWAELTLLGMGLLK